jgi:hypothetical protein
MVGGFSSQEIQDGQMLYVYDVDGSVHNIVPVYSTTSASNRASGVAANPSGFFAARPHGEGKLPALQPKPAEEADLRVSMRV